ncbi:hypothetical protein [Streptomyces sp. 891-h]|uniref:hypothetical protein n=1 Tax=Streptomyces sp. 891-h TaxID=2720714 RepID=UPI001FA98651|nr:hypothetical protein [Streptomyces sp. 891-h]UNZ21348.1 hypothetical protein HC362_34155 [Streptomyces sp. 891-h]
MLWVARADLEAVEGALLLAARSASVRTGKPLLMFKIISHALRTESEQAAQGHYCRKVSNLNGTGG